MRSLLDSTQMYADLFRFTRIKVERDTIKATSFTTKVTKSTKKFKKQEIPLFSFPFVSFVFFVVKYRSFSSVSKPFQRKHESSFVYDTS